jgi:hypothetical protein
VLSAVVGRLTPALDIVVFENAVVVPIPTFPATNKEVPEFAASK